MQKMSECVVMSLCCYRTYIVAVHLTHGAEHRAISTSTDLHCSRAVFSSITVPVSLHAPSCLNGCSTWWLHGSRCELVKASLCRSLLSLCRAHSSSSLPQPLTTAAAGAAAVHPALRR